jgi:hypothetical protein
MGSCDGWERLVISIWWALAAFVAGGCSSLLLIGLMITSADHADRPALICDTPSHEVPPR